LAPENIDRGLGGNWWMSGVAGSARVITPESWASSSTTQFTDS
jgi:hypothetical protein